MTSTREQRLAALMQWVQCFKWASDGGDDDSIKWLLLKSLKCYIPVWGYIGVAVWDQATAIFISIVCVANGDSKTVAVNIMRMLSSDQSFIVDPLSYFSFQPVLHDWCNKDWYVLSCL